MKTKTMVGTSIIIYTNKKTGISYDLVCTETDLNDVLRYKLASRDDDHTQIAVTKSTFKRWFKKDLYIDLNKDKKLYRKRNPSRKFANCIAEVEENCFFSFYPRPNMSYNVLKPDEVETHFPNLTINRKEAKVYSDLFPKGRRAYVSRKTGNVGIRNKGVLYELDGFKAYV